MKNQTLKIAATKNADKPVVMKNAWVGFVDIISSSRLSSALGLEQEWEMKRQFSEASARIADRNGVLLVNSTGDGFVFVLVGGERLACRSERLTSFVSELSGEFGEILATFGEPTAEVESGLRFGFAAGDILIGGMSGAGRQFTLVGAEVNLAARLCALAGANDFVVCEKIHAELHARAARVELKKSLQVKVKGFAQDVRAIHLSISNTSEPQLIKALALALSRAC